MPRLSQRRGRSPMDRRTFITGAAVSAAAVACSRAATSPPSAATSTKSAVTTNDGITLRYEEAGAGKPLVCIPGWSQTAAQFKHQLSGLSRPLPGDRGGHAGPWGIGQARQRLHHPAAGQGCAGPARRPQLDRRHAHGALDGKLRHLELLAALGPGPPVEADLRGPDADDHRGPALVATGERGRRRDLRPHVALRHDQPARRPGRGQDDRRVHRGYVHEGLLPARGGLGGRAAT